MISSFLNEVGSLNSFRMVCMCAIQMLSQSQTFQSPEQLLQNICFKRQILAKKILKFGGRCRNQVPSNLGACPGIHRKSIVLDQLRKISRSESNLQTGVGGYYLNKKKFGLFMLILVGIGRKTGFLQKGIL